MRTWAPAMNKTLKIYYERCLTYTQSGQNSIINSYVLYLPVSTITIILCLFLNFIVFGILKQIPDIISLQL